METVTLWYKRRGRFSSRATGLTPPAYSFYLSDLAAEGAKIPIPCQEPCELKSYVSRPLRICPCLPMALLVPLAWILERPSKMNDESNPELPKWFLPAWQWQFHQDGRRRFDLARGWLCSMGLH